MQIAVGIIAALLTFIALYMVFCYAAIQQTMLEVQKIFYFHVSAAATAYLAFFVTFVCSIVYLIKRSLRCDTLAVSSAEIGVVLCSVALLSGPIWARYAWNTWWTWEARLTTTLLLWLMYVAYLILRFTLTGEQKNIFSAVLGIIAFVNVPLVYFSVRFWRGGQHPPGNIALEPTMLWTFLISLLAFIATYIYLLLVRSSIESMTNELEELRIEIREAQIDAGEKL